jgi:hypothetical protein
MKIDLAKLSGEQLLMFYESVFTLSVLDPFNSLEERMEARAEILRRLNSPPPKKDEEKG